MTYKVTDKATYVATYERNQMTDKEMGNHKILVV